MLPDAPFETGSGRVFPTFSIEHLLWQNLAAAKSPQQIASALAKSLARTPAWEHAPLVAALVRRMVDRLDLTCDEALAAITNDKTSSKLDAIADRPIVEAAIRLGNGLGLGAAWGVSLESHLLWAAAAALLRHHGCLHPNQLPSS